MTNNDNKIDEILRDVEGRKISAEIQQITQPDEMNAAAVSAAQQKRQQQIDGFTLAIEMDDIADSVSAQTSAETTPTTEAPVSVVKAPPTKNKPRKERRWLKRLIYFTVVILISLSIAAAAIMFLLEATGLSGTNKKVDITIPQGAYTAQIADILDENGLIQYPLLFRAYAKLTKADGLWQMGTFVLSSNMGYSGLVEELQTATPRANVNVTIPEGYTVQEIAALLAEKGVCAEDDFYKAVMKSSYDYAFVKAIPTSKQNKEYKNRIYRLEGYLFPDTYNFFLDSTGEMVVEKMLSNFNEKLTPELRQKITDKGWTIDEAIIFASIIQGEAGQKEDMYAVSKVLTNRLQPGSGFPKLQCCSTRDYIRAINPTVPGIQVKAEAYDTYIREGFPIGAINNPGLQAIEAALNPSTDEKYMNCYYFATDYDTGITYYSQTLAQHEAICRRYKIGMYG